MNCVCTVIPAGFNNIPGIMLAGMCIIFSHVVSPAATATYKINYIYR